VVIAARAPAVLTAEVRGTVNLVVCLVAGRIARLLAVR
jgi:hypothetical protein